MNTIISASISSKTRMKPGDIFYSLNGLSVIIDIGYEENDPINGLWWHHEIRLATEEERIAYEVMES